MDVMEEMPGAPGTHDLSGDFAPKYIKLARILRMRIQRGEFRDGELFDRAGIAARYGVCVNTVTGALSSLSYNGYAEFTEEKGRFRVTYPQRTARS